MRLRAFLVNAFAEDLARGNPAGVVLTDAPLPDGTMRDIARDLNASETAFVETTGGGFGIRWFSPAKEMPLCGHATLAAARALFELHPERESIRFSYRAGSIAARKAPGFSIGLRFPLDRYETVPFDRDYFAFFGLADPTECIRGIGTGKVVLIADAALELRAIRPDFRAMLAGAGPYTNGIGITAPSGGAPYDFRTRYFNPWAGVDEDPVTGSVHTVLAAYWSRRLGKDRLAAYQDSQRPGSLGLALYGDEVEISGPARIVLSGEIAL